MNNLSDRRVVAYSALALILYRSHRALFQWPVPLHLDVSTLEAQQETAAHLTQNYIESSGSSKEESYFLRRIETASQAVSSNVWVVANSMGWSVLHGSLNKLIERASEIEPNSCPAPLYVMLGRLNTDMLKAAGEEVPDPEKINRVFRKWEKNFFKVYM